MQKQIVAAFDFDRTLTTKETLVPFFISHWGYLLTYFKLLKIVPTLLGFVFGWSTRIQTKEAILNEFLKGVPMEAARQWGTAFVKNGIPYLLKPEMMQRLRWHQNQGHQCVLVSAGINVYLEQWCKQEKFNDLLCSRLNIDKQGLLTGKLDGLNCWGPEKTKRLEELLGPREGYELYAYGDSRGDQEMLALADHPFKV